MVVPVPNKEGEMAGYVIPYWNQDFEDPERQYQFAGALIAMAIRTRISLPFSFPPLFWECMVTGRIRIEGIFEIDDGYRRLIQNLKEGEQSGLRSSSFWNNISQRFVVLDIRGMEHSLKPGGDSIPVTLDNVGEYIGLANDFRCKELANVLGCMRDGMWDNFGLDPIPGLHWTELQVLACWKERIDIDELKRVIDVHLNADQGDLFWKVVQRLIDNGECGALLKFATGCSRIPVANRRKGYIMKVTAGCEDSGFPRASTCVRQLQLPRYRSEDEAYKKIREAILSDSEMHEDDDDALE